VTVRTFVSIDYSGGKETMTQMELAVLSSLVDHGKKITINEKYLHGNHKDSQSIREEMTDESISWKAKNDVDDYHSDEQKRWTACGPPLLDKQLWFGKPGKEAGRERNPRPNDMRPNVWHVGKSPKKDSPIFPKPLTFKELVSPLSDLILLLDDDERKEVFSLIAGIKRPHSELFHRCVDGRVYFCPEIQTQVRIWELQAKTENEGPFSMIDYLLLLEGIARNEDVKYMHTPPYHRNKNSGRGNNVGTMMRAIKVRLDILDEAKAQDRVITKPVEALWNLFADQMNIENITKTELKEMTGNNDLWT